MKDETKFKDIHSPCFIMREKTISTLPEVSERVEVLARPMTKSSPYVVDESGFIPIAEAIKQLKGNSVSGGEIEQTYDFPNGVDDGRKIPYSRRTDCKDIAEISSAIMEDVGHITAEIEKGRAKKKSQDDFNKRLESIKAEPTTKTE